VVFHEYARIVEFYFIVVSKDGRADEQEMDDPGDDGGGDDPEGEDPETNAIENDGDLAEEMADEEETESSGGGDSDSSDGEQVQADDDGDDDYSVREMRFLTEISVFCEKNRKS